MPLEFLVPRSCHDDVSNHGAFLRGPAPGSASPGGTLAALPPPVTVFGAGHVGLVVAACLAEAAGCDVVCCDRDEGRVQWLQQGAVPFHEPGLDALLRAALASGRLRFTADAADALAEAEVVFIAVGTPGHDDGSADVGAVFQVAGCIARHATRPCTVVVKSTVPVGTTRRVQEMIGLAQRERQERPGHHRVRAVCCPEFLREGSAVQDFLRPERVVIGSDDAPAAQVVRRLHLALGVCAQRVLTMDTCSAELTKYAANAMLATRISFINELAALAEMARQLDCPMPLLAAVRAINDRQRRWPLEMLRQRWHGAFDGRRVAIWGLAFKPGIDDVRGSPGLWLAQALGALGATVVAHDFAIDGVALPGGEALPGVRVVSGSPLAAAHEADALVVATAWPAYARVPLPRLRRTMRQPLVIDGRGVFEPSSMRRLGFEVLCPGRQRATAAPGDTPVRDEPSRILSWSKEARPGLVEEPGADARAITPISANGSYRVNATRSTRYAQSG
ncbi:MAG: nucleotide sugar dehydrogenase [Burkholderiaceae bacterium]|nr:nucleotide sugar dehydrogenase [Burkholderiaceae bacterium]